MEQILALGIDPTCSDWPEQVASHLAALIERGEVGRVALLGKNGTALPVEEILRAAGLADCMTGSYDARHGSFDSFHLHDGFLFRDEADCCVLCLPPSEYRGKMRQVIHTAGKSYGFILPFTVTVGALSLEDPALNLENRSPIAMTCFPCAGTNRFIFPMQDILAKFEWKPAVTRSPLGNACFVARMEGRGVDEVLREIDAHLLGEMKGLDFFEMAFLHDPFSARLFAEIPDVRALLLIRDPRDIIVSYYHRLYGARTSTSDGLYVDEQREELKDRRFLEIFEGGIFQKTPSYFCPWPPLQKFCQDFIDAGRLPNVFSVKFEELHARPRETYRDILKWLNLESDIFRPPLSDEELDQSIYLGSFEAQTKGLRARGDEAQHVVMQGGIQTSCRKGVPGDWRIHFSEDVKRRFKELAGEELIALGYENDFNW